ncbi:ABC transporter permease [uncultured Tateyamaria sp.]|uniref:FtsX-like permease family protein n=1 Tax=uncultured Tateyamaria sp. TaxID=455651 RepID=UPI0026090E21|nr:ABC transporter permease [uncultured Tateyamaria sp.]
MIRTCLVALLSHWRRNPIQLFAYLAGLAIATGLWSGVQAINSEARASYDAAAATLGEGQFDRLIPRQGDAIAQETFVVLRRAGWLVSPVLDVTLNDVRVIGVDPVTSPTGLGGVTPPEGTSLFTTGPDTRLFANRNSARALGDLAQVIIDDTVAPGIAIGDIGAVQRLSGRNDLSTLVLLPEQPLVQPDLASIAPDLRLQPSQQVADVAQLTDSFHLNLTAFGLLSFAVGLFIVHSTIGLAFEQRRGMIRTIRSLGVPLRVLVGLIVVEMLALAAIGAVIGILLGYLMAALLLPDVAATLRGLYGAQVSGTLTLRPEWWLSGFLLAMLGTAFALAGRIWQVASMPLLASARPRAWVMSGAARFSAQAIVACVLLSAAAVLVIVAEGLILAFALLGCLLIGGALALPVIAARALAWIERGATRPIWQWFWADTRQQLPGLSLALMALLLAVAANVGVSTMVSSFRLTFVGFLDQRLAPELFVQAETPQESAALDAFLTREGIEALPLRSTPTQIEGQSVRLFGVRVGSTYRVSWVFLAERPQVWDDVADGAAVIVNEQLARRGNLWVGDMVEVAPTVTLPIAAVVGDYGNPQGQVVMSEALFETLHPDSYPGQYGIRTDDVTALRQRIADEVGIAKNAMIHQAAIKAASLEVFERTFTVTAALNVLTLGVAGFAILMSLLTLADLRVPQLAPVWAMGVTRRRLGGLELLRALGLAGLVFVFAIPLGLALAWVLLTLVNVEAFGWQLPMFLFPLEYLRLGAYALGAVTLAAAWPALRLIRTPPAALLKVFANER